MTFLNYHHFYYFYVVCQERGFTKASKKLRLSQSAISEQINRLEQVLGQKLIHRTTRTFELTENGTIALRYAEMIFGAGQELIDFMLHRPSQGKQMLRIGALGSLSRNLQARFVKPILNRKDIRFSLTIGDPKRLLKLLRDHEIDVVLSTYPASAIDAGRFYTHLLTESPLCIVSQKKSTQRDLSSIFKNSRVFLPSENLESRGDFDHFIEENKIQIDIAGEVDDLALLRLLALNGAGIVVIPRMGVINDIENKGLVVLHEFRNINQKYYAITRQKKFPNPLIAELVQASR